MADYEFNFYFPFKGLEKPIYAIPGNHDWFDALEGFNANFLEPRAASAALEARVEAHHPTSSVECGLGQDGSVPYELHVVRALRRAYIPKWGCVPASEA